MIRPLAKYYCFLWATANVGHRRGAQCSGGYDRQLGLPVTSVADEVA